MYKQCAGGEKIFGILILHEINNVIILYEFDKKNGRIPGRKRPKHTSFSHIRMDMKVINVTNIFWENIRTSLLKTNEIHSYSFKNRTNIITAHKICRKIKTLIAKTGSQQE